MPPTPLPTPPTLYISPKRKRSPPPAYPVACQVPRYSPNLTAARPCLNTDVYTLPLPAETQTAEAGSPSSAIASQLQELGIQGEGNERWHLPREAWDELGNPDTMRKRTKHADSGADGSGDHNMTGSAPAPATTISKNIPTHTPPRGPYPTTTTAAVSKITKEPSPASASDADSDIDTDPTPITLSPPPRHKHHKKHRRRFNSPPPKSKSNNTPKRRYSPPPASTSLSPPTSPSPSTTPSPPSSPSSSSSETSDTTSPSILNLGLNGIGFRPTPAAAYARAQRRRQQVAEWRSREARDARQRRSERRNAGRGSASGVVRGGAKSNSRRGARAGAAGGEEAEREEDEEGGADEDRGAKRRVRFLDVEVIE
ncbi:MAG: hypothetical protein M1819_006098 [Sarea resinae]|nr:MAG: hypothetical protein M1819_006098 [Sarea resinae]